MVSLASAGASLFAQLESSSSVLPIAVKDAVDTTGRTYMAHKESGHHEARERLIEEGCTSAVWIGGIPACKWLFDKIWFQHVKKLDPKLDLRKIRNDLNAQDILEKMDHNTEIEKVGIKKYFKDIKEHKFFSNISSGKYKQAKQIWNSLNTTQHIDSELKKVSENTAKEIKDYIPKILKTQQVKAFICTAAPFLALVSIPKLNQAISRHLIIDKAKGNGKDQKNAKKETVLTETKAVAKDLLHPNSKYDYKTTFSRFVTPQPSFKGGLGTLFLNAAQATQFNYVSNMMALDVAISGGRIARSRNKYERLEYVIKEGGILFFVYFASQMFKNVFDKFSNKIGIPIDLNSKVLNKIKANKKSLDSIGADFKKSALYSHLTEFDEAGFPGGKNAKMTAQTALDKIKARKAAEEKILDYINKNLQKDGTFKDDFLEYAREMKLIDVLSPEKIQKKLKQNNKMFNWAKEAKLIDENKYCLNPSKYVEIDKLIELKGHLGHFLEVSAEKIKSGKAEKAVINKTIGTKYALTLGNMMICSLFLGYLVPKFQYFVREHLTGTKEAPGIKVYEDQAEKLKDDGQLFSGTKHKKATKHV